MGRQKAVFIDVMDCGRTEKLNPIINEILNSEGEATPRTKSDDVEVHLWEADTKYYKADIDLCVLKKKSIMDETFSESVEAVLLYFDSRKELNGLEKMKSWISFTENWGPSIKLAVCEKCDREGGELLSRLEAQKWCLDHEFELVELDPDLEDYDEFEDVGLKRIKNALLAHIWPNIDMKNPQNVVKKMPSTCAVAVAKASPSLPLNSTALVDQLLEKENEFDDVIGDECEEDNFERLLSKLQVMKDQASSMPEDERKKFAENMAKAFWTALGGDDDEIAGLSSDDEKDNVT